MSLPEWTVLKRASLLTFVNKPSTQEHRIFCHRNEHCRACGVISCCTVLWRGVPW